jgi:hypothetical protein
MIPGLPAASGLHPAAITESECPSDANSDIRRLPIPYSAGYVAGEKVARAERPVIRFGVSGGREQGWAAGFRVPDTFALRAGADGAQWPGVWGVTTIGTVLRSEARLA